MSTREVQTAGEDAAAESLRSSGMRILARNWRCKLGELDIVAADGRTLVFVEVKARTSGGFVDPALAVDYRKQLRLRRVAEAFIALENPRFVTCRFDVVSVVTTQPYRLNHVIDAFQG
jgi:putative endonuclease